MNKLLKRILDDINSDKLGGYWPGFEAVAYAFYDRNNVYLFNHPAYKDKGQYHTLEWDNRFRGCTIILFEEHPTAIVDLDYFSDYESLYSVVVHELFHGYQYIKGEKRFPNEKLGMTYPVLEENIEIRNQERMCLYNAVTAVTIEELEHYIIDFITLREKRERLLNEYVEYENLVETIEGPAWYLESKAYADKSILLYNEILEKHYAPVLIDRKISSLDIRKSCMGSGLFICLILDVLAPDWKNNFFDSEESLFGILKQHVAERNNWTEGAITISQETKDIVDYVIKSRIKPIEEFEKQNGTHLYIEGPIVVTSFDPMNISYTEKKQLHQTFVGVRINDEEYVIQQPVVTYPKDGFKYVEKIHLILKDYPIKTDDSLIIEGIGEIKGRVKREGNKIFLFV